MAKSHPKVSPRVFPLTQQSGRVALLTGILEGYVDSMEIKIALEQDVQPRPRKKPVVAWGYRFDSVTLAAHWAQQRFSPRSPNAWRAFIAKKCNQDCWEGFYWTE